MVRFSMIFFVSERLVASPGLDFGLIIVLKISPVYESNVGVNPASADFVSMGPCIVRSVPSDRPVDSTVCWSSFLFGMVSRFRRFCPLEVS